MNKSVYGYITPHPPVLVPDVGRGRQRMAKKTITAMEQIGEEINYLRPETIVIISPHAPSFDDFIYFYSGEVLSGSLQAFGSNETLTFKHDKELSEEIVRQLKLNGFNGGSVDNVLLKKQSENGIDHGAFVPLYFASEYYNGFKVVIMSPSYMRIDKTYELGKVIRQAVANTGKRVVIIASGDMSHKVNEQSQYGACPEGAKFDNMLTDMLNAGDFESIISINEELRENADECGYRPLVILCGYFSEAKPQATVLSYEAPFGIGYLVAKLCLKVNGDAFYTKVAKQSLEHYVKHNTPIDKSEFSYLENITELTSKKSGVFVTIKKYGELRGCIGTTAPTTKSVLEEIIQNAISAGMQDPRFPPVSESELHSLSYSVDVLGDPMPVKSKDELDTKKYGIIVSKDFRRGLLLPDLDGVDTVDYQIEIALKKAGISPNEEYKIQKFIVTRHT